MGAASSEDTALARPSRTTTSMRRGNDPRRSKRTDAPSGAPACLPTTKGMADAQAVQRELRGGTRIVTGPGRGDTDVLLVHPRVHDPHVHELAVRDLSHRGSARSRRSAPRDTTGDRARRRAADVLGTPAGRRAPDERPARRHPRLVAGADLVLRRGAASASRGGGAGSPSSARSIPMRWDSTSRTVHPGHSEGRSHSASPRSRAKRVDGLPLLRQDRDDRLLCSARHDNLPSRSALGHALPGPRPV